VCKNNVKLAVVRLSRVGDGKRDYASEAGENKQQGNSGEKSWGHFKIEKRTAIGTVVGSWEPYSCEWTE